MIDENPDRARAVQKGNRIVISRGGTPDATPRSMQTSFKPSLKNIHGGREGFIKTILSEPHQKKEAELCEKFTPKKIVDKDTGNITVVSSDYTAKSINITPRREETIEVQKAALRQVESERRAAG